jgi:hypothetical protein
VEKNRQIIFKTVKNEHEKCCPNTKKIKFDIIKFIVKKAKIKADNFT